jgi:hypothetical protein
LRVAKASDHGSIALADVDSQTESLEAIVTQAALRNHSSY